jgi:hypothetical protein
VGGDGGRDGDKNGVGREGRGVFVCGRGGVKMVSLEGTVG